MRRTLAWLAVAVWLACGSEGESPSAASAEAPGARAVPGAPAPANAEPAPARSASERDPADVWKWEGEGEPGDLDADLKACEESVASDPRGGPRSPELVRLQLSVACMADKGWTPRRER